MLGVEEELLGLEPTEKNLVGFWSTTWGESA
jgi:hypothetical protein